MSEFELFCLHIASQAIGALNNDEEAVDYMERVYKIMQSSSEGEEGK